MKKDLSFREKIRFWKEKGVWLKKKTICNLEKYGIKSYIGLDGKISKNNSIWIVEKIEGKSNIVLVSSSENDIVVMKNSEEIHQEGVYIFGTEGVFFKKDKERPIIPILESQYEEIVVDTRLGIFIAYGENENVICKLSDYKIITGDKITTNDFKLFRLFGVYRGNLLGARIIVQKGNEYLYCYIGQNNIYTNVADKIYFKTSEEVNKLINNQLAQAYNYEKRCNVLVALVGNKIKQYFSFVEACFTMDKKYYFVTRKGEKETHILRNKDDGKYVDIGKIPRGNYEYLDTKCDVIFYKMKYLDGVLLLEIYKDEFKIRMYQGVADVRLAEPEIMEDNSLISVKPILIYEKIKE